MHYVPFYKVIVLKIELFESFIIDEKHFKNSMAADAYSEAMNKAGYVTVVCSM